MRRGEGGERARPVHEQACHSRVFAASGPRPFVRPNRSMAVQAGDSDGRRGFEWRGGEGSVRQGLRPKSSPVCAPPGGGPVSARPPNLTYSTHNTARTTPHTPAPTPSTQLADSACPCHHLGLSAPLQHPTRIRAPLPFPPQLHLPSPCPPPRTQISPMFVPEDEFDLPIFPFHDLHYVPCGSTGLVAPYIETGAGTMRAAVELMGLARAPDAAAPRRVVCDLGCGDAAFLLSLLAHVNRIQAELDLLPPPPPVHGVGVDYDPALIAAAARDAAAAGVEAEVAWLTYDFNADEENLVGQLLELKVTHVFAYLVPKQLALGTVRGILEGLRRAGVVVCAYRYHPGYLEAVRVDEVMGLEVYER